MVSLGQNEFTHLANIFKLVFQNKNCFILNQVSLKFVPSGSIGYKFVFHTKPLSEPMGMFTNAYMSLDLNELMN